MEQDLGFGLFDDFPEDDRHPLQIDEFEDSPDAHRELSGYNRNIYRLEKDGTELHRAIRKDNQRQIDEILAMYQVDLDRIRDYLMAKYQCDPNDRVWLRKFNLIAIDEEHCKSCKEMEKRSVACESLDQAIFVVLKTPADGEEVAVLHPNEVNRLEVFQLVRNLLPNGCISWNYPGTQMDPNGKDESYIETAALCGRNEIIARFFELGAALSLPEHNALLAACSSLHKDTIHWLLTEHFDDFDCTERNRDQMNAFLILMQRAKIELMDFVLKKMISYRQKHCNETELEAFNNIFHYENEDNLSSLIHLRRGLVQDKVEEYIVQYRLDLSYQWKGVTILECLLSRKIALEYCWEEIRLNPKLMGLVVYDETTIVHVCIRIGYLDFLGEMYERHPEVKQYFEKDGSFACLEGILFNKCKKSAVFVLENHAEYFLKNLDKLKEEIVLSMYNTDDFYEANGKLLIKYFPVLKAEMDEAIKKEPEFYPGQDLQLAFRNFNLEFDDVSIKAKDPKQSLDRIRGLKGVTLLHYAASKDSTKLFTELLDAGCDIEAVDVEGNYPIHYVRSVAMLNLIIEKHPEGRSLVHRTNCEGHSVLHRIFASSLDHEHLIALVEKIIECGADVNQLTNNGESIAFMIGDSTLLEVLRKYKVNLDVVNHEGITVLERHLRCKNACVARSLLPLLHKLPSFKSHAHKYLEPFMYSNRDFFSCDYQSFLEANPETTKLIFDSVYKHSREEASRLFCKACGSAHIFISERFLDYDYDLDYNYQDQDGYTPIVGLLSYMEESNGHLVKQLLKKGVDLELRNNWGRNALLTLVCRFRSAKWYDHDTRTVQLLLNHGAQIGSTDDDGNTALHYAFKEHELELAEVLMENGANLSVRNKDGKTPMEVASKMNVELLRFMT